MASRDRIIGIQFGLSGTDEIRERSCHEIKNMDVYKDKSPAEGGVYDLHLGSTEKSMKCRVCNLPGDECLGHSGHIHMPIPLVQPMAIEHVVKWLRIICHNCGRAHSCSGTYSECLSVMKRQQTDKKKQSAVRCMHCDKQQRSYSQGENKMTWIAETRDSSGRIQRKDILYTQDVLRIFQAIKPETLTQLGTGVAHPKNFFVTSMCAPANTVRPQVTRFGGTKNTSDNFTKMLSQLVKLKGTITGEEIEDSKSRRGIFKKKTSTIEDAVIEINCLYHHLIKGPVPKVKTNMNNKDGSPMDSLSNKLKSKTGDIRKYQLGKRSRDMTRTTITGNPRIPPDVLLYPQSFAKTIPKREHFQTYNETRIRSYLANARIDKYPRAHRIIKADGSHYSVNKLETGLISLNYGDIVEYDSCEGDHINFNRQPTLEICSISSHTIKVNPNPNNFTIGMNVIACDFYNADFDGDEMNTHHAKYTYSRNEIKMISSFKNYVISHTTNSPQIGQINDSIVGLFELTRSNVRMTRVQAMGLFKNTTFFPRFTKEEYTGRNIIDILLAKTPINYRGKPTFYMESLEPFMNYDPEEINVDIRQGIMHSGVLDAASIGSKGHKNIYHIIERDYGPDMMLEVMFNMQQVSIDYIAMRGFSMGTNDVILSKEARDRIRVEEGNLINESILISNKLNRGAIVAPIGKTQKEFFEELQKNALAPGDIFNEIILRDIRKEENGLLSMILSGSKGKLNNLMAITARGGQQLINGERLRENFGFRRTQVYATRFDSHPRAYGYITNSYISGQTGPEFYANACTARFDLITKALSTSVTGDKNRNATKNLENIFVDHFRRSMRGMKVVQILQGEDGLDPRKIERVNLSTAKMTVEKIKEEYSSCPADELERIMKDKHEITRVIIGLAKQRPGKDPVINRKIPFDLDRMIANKFGHEVMSRKPEHKNSEIVHRWLDGNNGSPGLERVFVNSRYTGKIPRQYELAVTFAKWYLRPLLSTSKYGSRLSTDELESVFLDIEASFKESMIDPGTNIGIQAAQCISAPMTQYALDSHTRSASGGTSKSGMTRINEIVGAQKTESMSSTAMYLVPELSIIDNKNSVQKIANMIEMMTLKRFVRRVDIFFEEYGKPVHSTTKHEIADIEKFNGIAVHKRPTDLINWCVRYELNKSELIMKGMSVHAIVKALTEQNEDQYFMYTSDTAKVTYIRQYFRPIKKKTADLGLITELSYKTEEQVIRGIPNIEAARVVNHTYHDNDFNSKSGFAIQTNGTNLLAIMMVPGLDHQQCHTNSIIEVEEVFGVLAARNKLIVELGEIVEKGDPRHQIMYADEMTRIGKVASIERPGYAVRDEGDILGRAALASPMKAFTDAALGRVAQEIDGISSNLLLGAIPHVGTLYTDTVLNEKFIKENVKVADYLDEL